MKTLQTTIKKVLQNYDYLHLYAITQLVKSEWWFESDVKNAEDIVNSLILEDIKINGIRSTFIKVWLEKYAIRKETELDNLYSYLKCRLSSFIFWEIDYHDIDYSNHLFWKDIFSESEVLLDMLNTLQNYWKIKSFTHISSKQVIIGF
jgi:hypothetical protein